MNAVGKEEEAVSQSTSLLSDQYRRRLYLIPFTLLSSVTKATNVEPPAAIKD